MSLSVHRSWAALCLSLCVLVCKAQDENGAQNIPWYVWLIIAVTFTIATVLIVAALIYIFHNFRRLCPPEPTVPPREEARTLMDRKPPKDPRLGTKIGRDSTDAPFPPRFSARETNMDWELLRNKVRLQQKLGIGEFGPIYDAEVELEKNLVTRALVKVFQQGTSQDLARFREDIDALMTFNHPRVAKLFGVVSHSPYWAVLELTVNGDLKTFLMNASTLETGNRPLLSVPQLVAMATDVASGVMYLESLQYVHKDIATRNCIVAQNLTVKITDFKISRYLFRSEYAVQADGSLMPLRWMAPESLLDNIFNLSTDVWSFGVLLWEIMSRGSFPYPELSDGEVVTAVCSQEYTLMQPLDCPPTVYQLMLRCWSGDPRGRPNMVTLHKFLESNIFTMHHPHTH